MSSGPGHYLEAERLLGEAWQAKGQARADMFTAAGVHAQLAQAAASVVRVSGGVQETLNRAGWSDALANPSREPHDPSAVDESQGWR